MLRILVALLMLAIAPQALEQRSRVGFLLAPEVRNRADALADELPVPTEPAQFEQRLAEVLGDPGRSPSVRLYAGVRYLKRSELTLDAYDARIRQLELAQERLHDYLDQLRGRQGPPGPAGAPLDPPVSPPWTIVETAEGLTVGRFLPYPTSATPAARLRLLRDAAEHDLEAAEQEQTRTEQAREAYRPRHLAWVDYCFALTNEVAAMKDAAVRALPGGEPEP